MRNVFGIAFLVSMVAILTSQVSKDGERIHSLEKELSKYQNKQKTINVTQSDTLIALNGMKYIATYDSAGNLKISPYSEGEK